jgi:hypothetical protein
MSINISNLKQDQKPMNLAGKTATVVYKDGTEKAVTFGPDVWLKWIGGQLLGAEESVYPAEISGYLTDLDFPKVEDAELIIGNDVFRFSTHGRGFFTATEPGSSRSKVNYDI